MKHPTQLHAPPQVSHCSPAARRMWTAAAGGPVWKWWYIQGSRFPINKDHLGMVGGYRHLWTTSFAPLAEEQPGRAQSLTCEWTTDFWPPGVRSDVFQGTMTHGES